MEVAVIAGVAVIAAILSAVLKRYHQEYAILVTIGAGILLLLGILSSITPILEKLEQMISLAGIEGDSLSILLKALGICFLAQFAADSCRDAGESALAAKVELAGKAAVVVLSLPLFENIASTALSLIGR